MKAVWGVYMYSVAWHSIAQSLYLLLNEMSDSGEAFVCLR